MKDTTTPSCDPSTGCCTPPAHSRRDFIKLSAMGATLMSIPFTACNAVSKTEQGFLIPADKKLSAAWLESLTQRGSLKQYHSDKDELKYIGMPVGGVCCGQLYLSGDGRLWLWDIFQTQYNREGPANPNATDHLKKWRLDQFSMGGLYVKPRTSDKENDRYQVESGFAVSYQQGQQYKTVSLDQNGFKDISFRGEYPIAKVNFKQEGLPFMAKLESYSPFIPLNLKDSSIPATVMSYEFTNTSKEALTLNVGGWLQNSVCPSVESDFQRTNKVITASNRTTVYMTATGDQLDTKLGYGNMALTLLKSEGQHFAKAQVNGDYGTSALEPKEIATTTAQASDALVGAISTSLELQPNESKKITFVVSWYFPYYNEMEKSPLAQIKDIEKLKRQYAKHYDDAQQVAEYLADNFDRLAGTTLLWNKTWYDGTLPYWFLDRSFISMDCLATQTAHLFDNDRFWAWEGVECCEGTCTHVWQYAQGMARIFPSIEKGMRQTVDYDIAYQDGSIGYRGENGMKNAIDGQLGTIIRVYREHQMSADKDFLLALWDKVKESMQYVIDQDLDLDGLLEGKQQNTLDAAWYGPMGWISSLYLAALASSEQMAMEVGDHSFAKTCQQILSKGKKNIVDKLFNGEYFIHLPPNYDRINTNKGSHIDQVLGQSFAHQVNLPDVLPKKEAKSALASLWKYNFAPDAGQYVEDHKAIKGDRVYVTKGEAGLLMTTWPLGGDENAVPGMADRPDDKEHWIGPGGYFDECMNGFEYQVASHMVWEGMLTEGLSIMKAIDERYHGAKRNPFDEVECSSHYVRSMASFGIYLAACGYTYHGPKATLGFAPKMTPEDFKCAFTTAEAWGTFSQKAKKKDHHASLSIAYGKLFLKQFSLELLRDSEVKKVNATLGGESINLSFEQKDNKLSLHFDQGLDLKESDLLAFEIKLS